MYKFKNKEVILKEEQKLIKDNKIINKLSKHLKKNRK